MKTLTSWAALCLAAAALIAGPALADDREHGEHGGRTAAPLSPRYVQECGACHLAYPPALLGAAAWQRQMNGLARHYGSDASLDPAATALISKWLQANAGTGRRVDAAPPQDRISRSTWFQSEHREVSRAQWARIKSASNCGACHTRAAEGSYREREISIPSQ